MDTLYHSSPEAITEIRDTGLFGGIFATDLIAAESHRGKHIYKIELEGDEVLDVMSRVDWDVIESVIVAETYAESDDDIQAVYEMLQRDMGADEDLWPLLTCESDPAYANWESQRLRGCIAKAAGYKAVECTDEHGTVYLVLPGAKVEIA